MGWYGWVYHDEKDKPKQVSWQLIRRVLGYARPHRWRLLGVLVTIGISTAIGLASPRLVGLLIDQALPNENTSGDPALLNFFALAIIALPMLNVAVSVVQRYLSASIGEGVIHDLRVGLFEHMQRMSMRFFTNTKTGELMSRLNNDVVGAQTAITSTLIGIITNLITVVATLSVMLTLEWRLTIFGLLVLPLFVLPARQIGLKLRIIAREQMDNNATMNAMMAETLNINGAMLVKLFGRARGEQARFASRAARVRDTGIRRAVLGTTMWATLGLVSLVGTAIVYWVGGHLALQGVFTTGLIVTFGMYLAQIYGPLQSLATAPAEFATSMVSFERVFEVIDIPVEIAEKPDAHALKDVQGAIEFEHVSFNYGALGNAGLLTEVERMGMNNVRAVFSEDLKDGKKADPKSDPKSDPKMELDKPSLSQARASALEDLSFKVEPGQLVALVGPSGAGKTTLTYLLLRLYDPTTGRIRIDGHDLKDVTLESLAQSIGVVTQETYLFHDTIKMNLLYANMDATDEQIVAAARAANIHDFIAELPEGYNTVVGERGYRLSGGEKQRIAIARVILKDPRILVLDEATSHLDSQSEALIQSALETVMQGRTSLVIAHRLSTILAADQILVLDRGRIVEHGTHSELVARGGLYASLYETQFNRVLS
jgi:ATP-binding cassette, subfamily B, bacterial